MWRYTAQQDSHISFFVFFNFKSDNDENRTLPPKTFNFATGPNKQIGNFATLSYIIKWY